MSMKFQAKVKELIKGIEPATMVAIKGTEKEYENAGLITLSNDDNGITILADGGRVSLSTEMPSDIVDMNYKSSDHGTITVRASDLIATLHSFDLNDEIKIEEKSLGPTGGREIIFTSLFDKEGETYQTLPVQIKDIEKSAIVKSFSDSKKIKIRRDIFLNAAKRLIFAHGYENNRPEFLYWLLNVKKNEIRFAAGTGGLFANIDVEGKEISEIKNDTQILIPNQATVPIIESLNTQKDDFVSIIPSDKYLTIRCGHIHMLICNLEPNIKWPDVDKILNRSSSVKITTRTDSWKPTVLGLTATYSEDLKKTGNYHIAHLEFDSSKKQIFAKTDGVMKAHRKVPVEDSKYDGQKKCDIKLLSEYLNICIKEAKDDEFVQLEIDPENAKAPVVVRYHAKQSVGNANEFIKVSDGSGVAEKYSLFFAPIIGK